MKRILLINILLVSLITFGQTPDAKMKGFVDGLMKKMTLEEKIGQLNLITPGSGIPTGAAD